MTLKLDGFSGTEMAQSLTQEYQPCSFALICSYQDSYASRKEVTMQLSGRLILTQWEQQQQPSIPHTTMTGVRPMNGRTSQDHVLCNDQQNTLSKSLV